MDQVLEDTRALLGSTWTERDEWREVAKRQGKRVEELEAVLRGILEEIEVLGGGTDAFRKAIATLQDPVYKDFAKNLLSQGD